MDCFADYTSDAEVSNGNGKRPSKFPSETCSPFHDGIIGKFMDKSASSANADRELWTTTLSAGNLAHGKREASTTETLFVFSRKPGIETPAARALQCMTGRKKA